MIECLDCNIEKRASEFYKNQTSRYCKACFKIRNVANLRKRMDADPIFKANHIAKTTAAAHRLYHTSAKFRADHVRRQRAWRKKKRLTDPTYFSRSTKRWVVKNRDKANKIARDSYYRCKKQGNK